MSENKKFGVLVISLAIVIFSGVIYNMQSRDCVFSGQYYLNDDRAFITHDVNLSACDNKLEIVNTGEVQISINKHFSYMEDNAMVIDTSDTAILLNSGESITLDLPELEEEKFYTIKFSSNYSSKASFEVVDPTV